MGKHGKSSIRNKHLSFYKYYLSGYANVITPTAMPMPMAMRILLTVNKLPVDMPNLLQNFSFSECATNNPNYLNDINIIS